MTSDAIKTKKINHIVIDPNYDGTINSNGESTEPSMFHMYLLTFLSCIGGFLFGYDTGVISGALILLKDEFHLSDTEQELVVGLAVAGALVASIFAGYLTDTFGRRPIILVSCLLFALGSLVLFMAQGLSTLLVGRFFVGLGVGVASSIFSIYVSECAPTDKRGTLVTTINVAITFGQFFSSSIDASLVRVPHGWRYMLGFGVLPAVIQFLGFLLYMPESPRWLIDHKMVDRATLALQHLRDRFDVREEIQEILLSCNDDNINSNTNLNSNQSQKGIKSITQVIEALKEVSVQRSLLLGCMLQAAQQFCGINTVMYYSATILSFAGFGSNLEIMLWLTAVVSFCNFIGSCGGLYAVDRIGRRPLTLSSLLGVSLCLALLSISFYLAEVKSVERYNVGSINGSSSCTNYIYCFDCIQDDNCGWCSNLNPMGAGCIASDDSKPLNTSQCPASEAFYSGSCPGNGLNYGWMIFVSLCCYLLVFSPGMGCMPWTITSEIFPTHVRGLCNSISTTTNWTSNLIMSLSFLSIANAVTKQGAFAIYSMVALLFFVFFYFYLPETKDLSLEDIQTLFSSHGWGRYSLLQAFAESEQGSLRSWGNSPKSNDSSGEKRLKSYEKPFLEPNPSCSYLSICEDSSNHSVRSIDINTSTDERVDKRTTVSNPLYSESHPPRSYLKGIAQNSMLDNNVESRLIGYHPIEFQPIFIIEDNECDGNENNGSKEEDDRSDWYRSDGESHRNDNIGTDRTNNNQRNHSRLSNPSSGCMNLPINRYYGKDEE